MRNLDRNSFLTICPGITEYIQLQDRIRDVKGYEALAPFKVGLFPDFSVLSKIIVEIQAFSVL